MQKNFNGWQRLWILASSILGLAAIAFAALQWPIRDAAVVTDLASASCKYWLEVPPGFVPAKRPEYDDGCYALKQFMFSTGVDLHSVADYDKAVASSRQRWVLMLAGVWFAVVAAMYSFGWTTGWVIDGFRASRRQDTHL